MFKTCVIILIVASVTAANPGFRCGVEVAATCPSRESCPDHKPICGAKRVLDRNASGCCCRSKYENRCEANEEYNCKCADSVCNQPDKVCVRCLDGCHCKQGYVRDKEQGVCIRANQCPVQQTCTGAHEVFGCGCRDTICNEPDIVCVRCQDGCFCEEGYVRDTFNGKCIRPNQCPVQPPCTGANEEYYCKCADSVCNQPDKNCIQCLDSCYCAEGYVRDVEGGQCILANTCPALD